MPLAQLSVHTAIVFERSDLVALEVIGPDRLSWLQGMLTCDLGPLDEGKCVHGLALNRQGKILADVIVTKQQQRILLAVDDTIAPSLREHLDNHLIMEDAEVLPVEESHRLLLAIGPSSENLAQLFPSCHAAKGTLLGWPADLVYCPSPTQSPGMTPKNIASLKEFHDHRIELGIPLFGQDFGPTNSPLEIGLDEHCISFDKGCYVGQEVVARLRSRGKSVRILKRLHFAQDITPTPNATVTLPSGKEVGVITSSGWAGDHGIAYAVLRRSDAETADKVVAEGQEAEIGPAWGLFHGF